jgi:uncharacterized protein (DUF427 family)
MFEAVYQGQVITRSDDMVVIEGNRYFPPGDVDERYLQRSRMKTLCPCKGVASCYTVQVDGVSDRNAAWTYRHLSPLARSIKNHIAFWGAVKVRDTDAG